MKIPAPRMILPAMRGWSGLNLKRRRGNGLEDNEAKEADGEGDEAGSGSESEGDQSDSVEGSLDDGSSSASTASEDLSSPSTPTSATDVSPKAQFKTLPYGSCPICLQPWTNPTITPTGYVGCYLCLYKFVDRYGKCPVTGMDMKASGGVDGLRKVLI